MGLSNFPSAAEGVLPLLVMNTVLSVALLKNMVRSLLHVVGAATSSNLDNEDSDGYPEQETMNNARERRISITQFKSLRHEGSAAAGISGCCSGSGSGCGGGGGGGSGSGWANTVECCVCLCGFEADEEVSELSCKHFFHKGCLDKWFDDKHTTCPLCRSIR